MFTTEAPPKAFTVIAVVFNKSNEVLPVVIDVVKAGLISVLLLKASVPARVAKVPVVGRVTFVAAVEVNVVENAPEVIKLEPLAIVRVELVAGAVIVTLLIEVAVDAPSIGVISVGEVLKTAFPVPVLVVKAANKLAEDGVPRKVATLLPKPDNLDNDATLLFGLKFPIILRIYIF
jgi:hypothetical protein